MDDPDSEENPVIDDKNYCDDVNLFGRDYQAMYLIELRSGTQERRAARAVGFVPRAVQQFRKNTPTFNEECIEAQKEADEEVIEAIRRAAVRGEPWAGRTMAEKFGWKDKEQQGAGSITNNNVFLDGSGNPMERIRKLQEEAFRRADAAPQAIPAAKPHKVIDVSLADNSSDD
jgi:hypothetical protein